MNKIREFFGELIGTFIIVIFGCGAIAVSVLFSAYQGLFQVAAIWGIGVTLAIYVSRALSCAHLNPAISIAFVLAKRMPAKKLLHYLFGQFLGAFLAACVLYILFSGSIIKFEAMNNIIRGTPESIRTAMIFADYFPNPAFEKMSIVVSLFNAFTAECFGTFLLVFFILCLTEGCNVGRPDSSIVPAFIGGAVAGIICIISPLTQAGLNPARDFAPRLFAYLAGYKTIAIPGASGGFLSVYILAPIVGGIIASFVFVKLLEPLMKNKDCKGCN
ncbi:MAG: aquaporin family protein [Candidatus Omnitrophica bacterium]|nr:aquaporin family protein [Candidatus Omnitrophota bacterium]